MHTRSLKNIQRRAVCPVPPLAVPSVLMRQKERQQRPQGNASCWPLSMKNDFKMMPRSSARRQRRLHHRRQIWSPLHVEWLCVFFCRTADLVTFCTPLTAMKGFDLRPGELILQPHLQISSSLPTPTRKLVYLSKTVLLSGYFKMIHWAEVLM